MIFNVLNDKVQKACIGILLVCIGTVWVLYLSFGLQLIDVLYKEESNWIADLIMRGRAVTPVERYYRAADEALLTGSIWVLASYFALVLCAKRPLGVLLAGSSVVFFTFLLFCLLEVFPSLVRPLHLELLSYYSYKTNYLFDSELAYREKPLNRDATSGFQGSHYSLLYGVDVVPTRVEWVVDEDGFRNTRTMAIADVVAIGDSYLEFGNDDFDTFPARLERHLGGLTVKNLGKSGYGPFQYLEVLNRWGLSHRPKYVLFSFYEGNDISDLKQYLQWKEGRVEKGARLVYRLPQMSFFERYWEVLAEMAGSIRKAVSFLVELTAVKVAQTRGYAARIHPNLALLNLGKKHNELLFVDHLSTASTGEMLQTREWREFKNILNRTKEICAQNKIVPIILYIPAAAHIYAQYTTEGSGYKWLQIRAQQIAAKENTENAVKEIARELGMDLFSLTPAFELAAAEGKRLYHRLDSHWNSDGRELAAAAVADMLRSKVIPESQQRSQSQRSYADLPPSSLGDRSSSRWTSGHFGSNSSVAQTLK